MRLSVIRKHEQTLFLNTDELMQKELKKTGSSEEVVGTGAMNKSVYHPPSSSSGGPQGARKQGNKGSGFFLTETAEKNIDELIQQAPFTFKFIPTKNIL